MRHGKSLSRFLRVGLAAAATDYLLFYVLYKELGLPLIVANSISFLAGFVVSFSLNRWWAFNKGSEYRLRLRAQMGFYSGLAAINLMFSNALIGYLRLLGVEGMLSKLTTMIFIAGWNYLILKMFVFSENSKEDRNLT
ncbi:MAG: GtrA family protein [Patescibacteria group bacterium]